MLKKSKLLLIPFTLISLTACGENPGPEPEKKQDPCAGDPVYSGEDINVSKIVQNTGGYNIQVENKDFLFLGTQIRVDAFMNCDKYTYADIKNLFKEAAELGVTCVQIPVEWSKVEIAEDVYDFTYVHEMLRYTNEYNLRCEFLWFGSNMCGDTHSYSVPNYILADGKTYPKFDALRTGEYWNYYGIMWFLDFDNQNLITRESLAAKKLMEYVYEFDSTHGAKKPLIGVQVENEADIFARFRLDDKNVLDPSTHQKMTKEVAFTKTCNSLDAIGKTFKQAKYKVYTRANLASSTNGYGIYSGDTVKVPPSFATQFQSLEGIDIVGDDSYTSSVKNIKGLSYMFGKNMPGNFSHIAENAGNYANTQSLMLAAVSQHGGYSIYDLMTSPFFIENGTGSGVDQGIISPGSDRSTFIHREQYAETQALIKGLKKVESEVYKLESSDFIAFNVKNDYQQQTIEQNISSTNVTVNFQTNKKGLGFALDFENYVDIFATQDSSISISNGTVTKIQKGEIVNGEFVESELISGGTKVSIKGGELYRFTYTSSGKITSTTWANIG